MDEYVRHVVKLDLVARRILAIPSTSASSPPRPGSRS